VTIKRAFTTTHNEFPKKFLNNAFIKTDTWAVEMLLMEIFTIILTMTDNNTKRDY
jgi:hypothetical protein